MSERGAAGKMRSVATDPKAHAEFRVLPDAHAVARAAADVFASAAHEAVASRGRFTVALAGGTTPRAVHALLADGPAGPLPWGDTLFFFGDERCVPPEDPASNFRMAQETLLGRIPVTASQVFRMEGELEERDLAARRYEEVLRRETAAAGGLDLVLLGMGDDGHTASLFPGSPVLEEKRRWVAPADAPPNVVPRQRITLTFPALAAARRVVFVVFSESKREALRRVRESSPPLLPVALVRARESVLWIVDVAAAGRT